MTAYTGTITKRGRSGELGAEHTARLSFALAGTALGTADTITWTNVLPNGKCFIGQGTFSSPELDTGATPTFKFKIGDGTTTDGYMLETGGALELSNSLPGQVVKFFNGTLVNADTTSSTGRSVVLTPTAAALTTTTQGTIFINIPIQGVA